MQRKQNVWMGRDNEFRTYKRPEQAVVSKSVQDAMSLYAQAGASLRKHNFSFGFEDSKKQIDANANQAAVMKKSIYEYTKQSNESIGAWRKEQLAKNRASNIQWGLKAEQAISHDTAYGNGLGKNMMNQTFTNLRSSTNDMTRGERYTIDSSRTAAKTISNRLDPPISLKDLRDQGANLLNRGGKRIDHQNAQKKTVVGAHIVNENSHEPSNLEKGKLGRDNITSKAANLISESNVQLSHQKRSGSGLKMNSAGEKARFSKSINALPANRQLAYDTYMGGNLVGAGRNESKPAAGSANLMSP